MKKFLLLPIGFEPLTPEVMTAWEEWFKSIADKVVDGGNPLGAGREITPTGTK